MRLPHRVPWSSIAELDQVCAWIYTDQTDLLAKSKAINRLAAWKAVTVLPHALEATHALLVVLALDSVPYPTLSLRHAYSAAIIRFVNGLVDPLQSGVFARSIASIAAQLGLPAWLVELRHAATHEDLPSIELLRDAANQAMIWLLHNYFLPTLNPSVTPAHNKQQRLLLPILKQYKSLLKTVVRDASLRSSSRPAINKVFREFERWIAEARVTADVVGEEWSEGDLELPDLRERWALERVSEALLEKGALVPLSKKKRIVRDDDFRPPPFSEQLWSPLLQNIQLMHVNFLGILCVQIISMLFDTNTDRDLSYGVCLARWAMWTIERWEVREHRSDLRKEAIVRLMQAFGRDTAQKPAVTLLKRLCAGNAELEETLKSMSNPISYASSVWDPSDMNVMEFRLRALTSPSQKYQSEDSVTGISKSSHDSELVAEGWRLLDAQSLWKPCPIGVYNPG